MTPPVFVCAADELRGDLITLGGAEGRHATTVRRLAPGERVLLTDGAGLAAECEVIAARPKAGELDVAVLTRRIEPPPRCRVVVVQALLKGDRAELAVELMTEVGVDMIVPWAAQRSVAQWRAEHVDKALARWRSTAREAAKQSRRCRFPEVTRPVKTADAVAQAAVADAAVLLDPEADLSLVDLVSAWRGRLSGEIVLIVGPEGGVAPAESVLFQTAGARVARLGPSVLRGSTAGAVAAALVLSGCGRWDVAGS